MPISLSVAGLPVRGRQYHPIMAVNALHDATAIAAFIGNGETRLIVAAYRDPLRSSELYTLVDGTAAEVRAFAKAELRCAFADCPRPELTTVARARKRDGFSHLAGAGKHVPESLNHLAGKAVVATWLRSLAVVDEVIIEAASDTQRSRVADVMATLAGGQRIAFEIQYASLRISEWRQRHESYREQGILDVWLWGHTRIRQAAGWPDGGPVSVALEDVQDEARLAGGPVMFINPERGELAVAATDVDGEVIWPEGRNVGLRSGLLVECGLGSNGIEWERLRELEQATRDRAARLEAEELRRRDERAVRERRVANARTEPRQPTPRQTGLRPGDSIPRPPESRDEGRRWYGRLSNTTVWIDSYGAAFRIDAMDAMALEQAMAMLEQNDAYVRARVQRIRSTGSEETSAREWITGSPLYRALRAALARFLPG